MNGEETKIVTEKWVELYHNDYSVWWLIHGNWGGGEELGSRRAQSMCVKSLAIPTNVEIVPPA